MKKTLIALAALAATGAFAQSSVTLSGRASMDISSYSATGSTAGAGSDFSNRMRVADTASRITFAANEDLGGGLKAGVYCETGLNIDSGNANGQANTANVNTTTWCSREGRLYFGNNTAEVRLGRQNVWWTQGALNPVGSTYLGSDTLTNMINGNVGLYGVRVENMIMLNGNAGLGAFAGSQVYAGYMGGATGEATGPNTAANGTYNGFKLSYSNGPIVGMIDYQNSSNSPAATAATGNTSSFDRTAVKYGVGYKYAAESIVTLQYWNKERTDRSNAANAFALPGATVGSTANTGTGKDSGFGINVNHTMGNVMLIAQAARNFNTTGTVAGEVADSGATAYTVGATYRLSKRTHVYGALHNIYNQANSNIGMAGGNYQSAINANGATVQMMALGMQHNF